MTDHTDDKPSVLYVCIHNAGRSQMAAALAGHLSARRVHVRSAGVVTRRRGQPDRDHGGPGARHRLDHAPPETVVRQRPAGR